jgi:hypothetical protein
MSCCGGGARFNGTSGLSGSAFGPSTLSKPDGPWRVIRPIRGNVNGRTNVPVRHENIVVATYPEAEQLIREIDPSTGFPFGGGITRAPEGTPLTTPGSPEAAAAV